MTLFAASVALAALLIVSYGTRRVWLVCLSVAISAATVAGFLLLATADNPGEVRARVSLLASKLATVLDRQTVDALTASIEQVSKQVFQGDVGAGLATAPAVAGSQAQQAAVTTGWFGAKEAPRGEANSPVTWLLDDPNAPVTSPLEDGFAIVGINVSGEELKDVKGTLKPDGSQREVALLLKVEGHPSEGAAAIPAGARFSLGSEAPKADLVRSSGGAILTFRYRHAGQQKSTILYLNAATLARFASRG